MILLQDLLKDFIAPESNIFMQMIQQKRLDSELRKSLSTSEDKGIIWIRNCAESINQSYGALDIIELGKSLSTPDLDTNIWENLYKFTSQSVPFDTLSNLILPKIQLRSMDIITNTDLIGIVNSKVAQESTCKFTYADSKYQLLNESDVDLILETSISPNFKYTAEVRDCDDFSRIIRGWLSMIGYGNVTLGTAWYYGYDENDKLILSHSVVLLVYKDKDGNIQTTYAEPQKNNKKWATDGTPSGMFWSQNVKRIAANLLYF